MVILTIVIKIRHHDHLMTDMKQASLDFDNTKAAETARLALTRLANMINSRWAWPVAKGSDRPIWYEIERSRQGSVISGEITVYNI